MSLNFIIGIIVKRGYRQKLKIQTISWLKNCDVDSDSYSDSVDSYYFQDSNSYSKKCWTRTRTGTRIFSQSGLEPFQNENCF